MPRPLCIRSTPSSLQSSSNCRQSSPYGRKSFRAERTSSDNHPRPYSLNPNVFHYLTVRGRQGFIGLAWWPAWFGRNFKDPPEPAEVSWGFLKVNSDFEGITRHWRGQIVKFAIPRQTRRRPKQNLQLNPVSREKTQRNRLQKTGKALNMICSLCIGTSIAYQLPCSQLV